MSGYFEVGEADCIEEPYNMIQNEFYQVPGVVSQGTFSRDSKYLLLAIQGFGFKLLDVSDTKNIMKLSDLKIDGHEGPYGVAIKQRNPK